MTKSLAFAFVAVLVTLISAPATFAQPASGDAVCAAAIAGDGQFARYEQVFLTGGPGSQVVVGTEGDDVLSGDSGNDVLCGLGGNDVLSGDSGNDILVGGSGADQLYGQSGGDTIYGDFADTVLDGGSGRNQVHTAQPPPPAVVFVASVNAPDETGNCDVSFTLTNGPANARILVTVTREDGSGVGVRVTSDDSGFAQGSVGGFTVGTNVVGAEAQNDDIAVIIAEIPIEQTCGA